MTPHSTATHDRRAERDAVAAGFDGRAVGGECARCAAAALRGASLRRALGGLESRSAPRELDSAVEASFAPEHRTQRIARALAGLRELPAPRELEGRVVAATHAGHRQQRAASALGSLRRRVAPPGLERALARVLHDPFAAIRSAPGELERRVAADLRRPDSASNQARPRRALPGASGLAAAAALLALMLFLDRPRPEGEAERGERVAQVQTRTFRHRRLDSIGELSPQSRAWLEAFAGPVAFTADLSPADRPQGSAPATPERRRGQ